jgi:hypothetical protein
MHSGSINDAIAIGRLKTVKIQPKGEKADIIWEMIKLAFLRG